MAIRGYSIALGVAVGVFMQLSTLGVIFVVLSAAKNVSLKASTSTLSVAYSFLTLMLALVLLAVVRQILKVALSGGKHDSMLHYILKQLEYYFIMGSLMGVCSSWIVTDISLGMQCQIAFAASLFIAGLAVTYFLGDSEDLTDEVAARNEESDENVETEYHAMVV